MNIAQRHRAILECIHKRKSVSVIGLSKDLEVSEVTIRKDIRLLEGKNLVFRKHGRAFAKQNSSPETDGPLKQKIIQQSKMGRAAVSLLKEREAVMVGAGSSLWHFAKCVPDNLSLTVVTSSLMVAAELISRPRVDVIQLAGSVQKGGASVGGIYAERGLNDLNFNVLFLEADGLDVEQGLTINNAAESYLVRRMVTRSQKVVVIVESAKLGCVSFGKVCEFQEVTHVITDRSASRNIVDQIRMMGVSIILV